MLSKLLTQQFLLNIMCLSMFSVNVFVLCDCYCYFLMVCVESSVFWLIVFSMIIYLLIMLM